jgi:hypothetical protein
VQHAIRISLALGDGLGNGLRSPEFAINLTDLVRKVRSSASQPTALNNFIT